MKSKLWISMMNRILWNYYVLTAGGFNGIYENIGDYYHYKQRTVLAMSRMALKPRNTLSWIPAIDSSTELNEWINRGIYETHSLHYRTIVPCHIYLDLGNVSEMLAYLETLGKKMMKTVIFQQKHQLHRMKTHQWRQQLGQDAFWLAESKPPFLMQLR